MKEAKISIKQIINRTTDIDTVFWLFPPLMVLLIAGTLAQKSMGLWPAIDKYFGGFILWLGPMPLPGAFTLLGLLFLSLLLRFIFRTEWRMEKAGIHLAHLGTLVLLIGGLLTAITAKESYMIIPEGEQTPYIYSYTERELQIFEGQKQIYNGNFEDIQNWNFDTLPFDIEILNSCKNCEIVERESDTHETLQGMAQNMAFKRKPVEAEPELNLTGIEFLLKNTDQDGHYIAFDGMPQPIQISSNERNFTLIFGKSQQQLPFQIKLNDFVKENYAGSSFAEGYRSEIEVIDDNTSWPATIEMNKPLRYGGYTFFQSAFEQTPEIEMTILAVVKNQGQIFPYIGAIIMGLGLLLHVFIFTLYKKRTAQ